MKKIIILFFTLIMVLTLYACSNESRFIGVWESPDSPKVLVLNEDLTYDIIFIRTSEFANNESLLEIWQSGTFNISRKQITFSYTYNESSNTYTYDISDTEITSSLSESIEQTVQFVKTNGETLINDLVGIWTLDTERNNASYVSVFQEGYAQLVFLEDATFYAEADIIIPKNYIVYANQAYLYKISYTYNDSSAYTNITASINEEDILVLSMINFNASLFGIDEEIELYYSKS